MAFHDVQFPIDISYGSSGGPLFSTTVLELASGFEKRNINWSQAKAIYNVAYGIKDAVDLDTLRAFFYARFGRAYTFRYKDWADFETGIQVLGTGDGIEVDFQITKQYVSGLNTYDRKIVTVVGDTTGVKVNGIPVTVVPVGGTLGVHGDVEVNLLTGVLTFDVAPPDTEEVAVTACEFDVHCRFDLDVMDVIHDFWQTQSWPQIPVVEVRETATV